MARHEEWWLECGGGNGANRRVYHSISAEVRGDAGILLTCEAAHGCWVHVRALALCVDVDVGVRRKVGGHSETNIGSLLFRRTVDIVGRQDRVPLGNGRTQVPAPVLGVVRVICSSPGSVSSLYIDS
jgi:hypothetical protein